MFSRIFTASNNARKPTIAVKQKNIPEMNPQWKEDPDNWGTLPTDSAEWCARCSFSRNQSIADAKKQQNMRPQTHLRAVLNRAGNNR